MDVIKNKTDEELIGYFNDYVKSFSDMERHSKTACDEVTEYDKLVEYFFPKELKPQVTLYNKMMDVAVEFEQSGFMAGYRLCLKHLQGQGKAFKAQPINNTPTGEKTLLEAISKQTDTVDFITSRQIGEMFSAPNSKIVYRIKGRILPYLTDEERKGFTLTVEKIRRSKCVEVYRLNKGACEIYLDYIQDFVKFANIAAGVGEFKKMMQQVFAA